MGVISKDGDHVLASVGSVLLSLYRRPYKFSDMPIMEAAFDDQLKTYGEKGGAIILVDTRPWTKADLGTLRDEDTRAALQRMQKKYMSGQGPSAVVLMGSGVIVSMVRSLAIGFSLVSGGGNRKYFASAGPAAAWLEQAGNPDAKGIEQTMGELAPWSVS